MVFKPELFPVQHSRMWAEELVSAWAIGLCRKWGLTHMLPPPFCLNELLCSMLRSLLLLDFSGGQFSPVIVLRP